MAKKHEAEDQDAVDASEGERPESIYRVGIERTSEIIVTSTNDVAGHRVTRYLGIVRGIVVRSPSIGQGFIGAFKSIGGGNIHRHVEAAQPVGFQPVPVQPRRARMRHGRADHTGEGNARMVGHVGMSPRARSQVKSSIIGSPRIVK
jgi:hypothetical protein